jgi:hypothetical protein
MKIHANLVANSLWKPALWIAAAAVFAVAASAQTTAAGESASESLNAASQAGQASASAGEATGVSAELSKKIDSRNAKAGDEVVAKTTADARLADGTKLPRGSRLVGHVTDAEAKSHDNRDSRLAFDFDHAVLKDGRDVPIHATMRSISAPAPVASAGGSDDLFAGGGMQGGGMAGGGARGGLGGGAVGGGSSNSPGLANSASGVVRGAGGVATNTSGAAAGGISNAASGVDGTANSTLRATSDIGANGTAIGSTAGVTGGSVVGPAIPVGNLSGVTFATVNAAGSASTRGANASAGTSSSTLLTGHNRNVSLDSGSQMNLGISPQ